MTYLVKVFHRNFTNSLDIYSVLSKKRKYIIDFIKKK